MAQSMKRKRNGVMRLELGKEVANQLRFLAGYLWCGDVATEEDELNNAARVAITAYYHDAKRTIREIQDRGKSASVNPGDGTTSHMPGRLDSDGGTATGAVDNPIATAGADAAGSGVGSDGGDSKSPSGDSSIAATGPVHKRGKK